MRTLNRNKQTMFYALLLGTEPIYKTDEEGNLVIRNGRKIPTGEYREIYSEAKKFRSSISMSGGESQAVDYGVDFSSYDASLILPKNFTPLKEMSLVWHVSEVKYKEDGSVDPKSADYLVKRKSPSLNYDKFLLSRIVK